MQYTRTQVAHMLGISMDTLRYYEERGFVRVSHDAPSGRVRYTEYDLMNLLGIRKLKGFGYCNEEILPLMNVKGDDPLCSFETLIGRLTAERAKIDEQIAYMQQLSCIYRDIDSQVGEVRIATLTEREFLLFERANSAAIELAMQGQPYLNYGYFIDRRCLTEEIPWHISLAMDIAPLRCHAPALHARLMDTGCVLSNGAGQKVYQYTRCENMDNLSPADFTPLLAYAKAHCFEAYGDVFGGLLSPGAVQLGDDTRCLITQTISIR